MRSLALAATLALTTSACGGGGDAAVSGPLDGGVVPPETGTNGRHADAAVPDVGTPEADDGVAPPMPLPALPLQTQGRWIVDHNGKRFKLASVNWSGAESADFAPAGLEHASVDAIAQLIRSVGFNSVRLPWSNELFETNPLVDPMRLSANPALVGKTALEVLDAVIFALARAGLVVILDNHRSDANWCCDLPHGDGLWYTPTYPEASWLSDWRGIVKRYASQPAVVGADLRNELRTTFDPSAPTTCTACGTGCPCIDPVWGGGSPINDWYAAAGRGGNAVLAENPALLVMVEGLGYSLDLTGVYNLPLSLSVPNRLVYAPHDYSFSHGAYATYADMKADLGSKWGYILTQGKPFTAPIWVGEFGTDHTASGTSGSSGEGFWFQSFEQYLKDADIDWAYWSLNGTQSTGYSRTLGAPEGYGVLDPTWRNPAFAGLTSVLQSLEPATQGP